MRTAIRTASPLSRVGESSLRGRAGVGPLPRPVWVLLEFSFYVSDQQWKNEGGSIELDPFDDDDGLAFLLHQLSGNGALDRLHTNELVILLVAHVIERVDDAAAAHLEDGGALDRTF